MFYLKFFQLFLRPLQICSQFLTDELRGPKLIWIFLKKKNHFESAKALDMFFNKFANFFWNLLIDHEFLKLLDWMNKFQFMWSTKVRWPFYFEEKSAASRWG